MCPPLSPRIDKLDQANVASPSSTLTLTATSESLQILTPSADIDVVLPSTGVLKGRVFTINNLSDDYACDVKVDSTLLAKVFGMFKVVALQDTPTATSHWKILKLTEYAWNSSATAADDSTSFGYGPNGMLIQNFAPAGVTGILKRAQFLVPAKATDNIQIEFKYNNVTWVKPETTGIQFQRDGSNVRYGVNLYSQTGSDTDFNIYFYNKPRINESETWTNFNSSGWRWRVVKITG